MLHLYQIGFKVQLHPQGINVDSSEDCNPPRYFMKKLNIFVILIMTVRMLLQFLYEVNDVKIHEERYEKLKVLLPIVICHVTEGLA